MTREEAIKNIKEHCYFASLLPQAKEALDVAIKALQQQSCGDVISRQAALDCLTATELKKFDFILHARKKIKKLPPVTPQPKMGCEGCIYEKTGNNSTYPCSHCSRCYTDKYKAERSIGNDKSIWLFR